jgi:GNAT superfamily N-acetyltransferase
LNGVSIEVTDSAPRVVRRPDSFEPGDVARVTVELAVTGEAADDLYEMYRAAFLPLHSRAAFGHLLPREEFDRELVAPTVNKIIAWDHMDRAIGMATLTTDLNTEPVSEWFYADRFPEEYARNDLYYLGFLLVRPDAQRGGVLAAMVRTVVSHVGDAGGIVAFDVCKFNDDTFKFAEICALLARRIRPCSISTVDVQTFYAVSFPPAN